MRRWSWRCSNCLACTRPRPAVSLSCGMRAATPPDIPRLWRDAYDRRLALRILARGRALASRALGGKRLKLLPRILPGEDEEDLRLDESERGTEGVPDSGAQRSVWIWTAAIAIGAAIPRL